MPAGSIWARPPPDGAIRLAPRQGTYDAEIQLNAVLSAGELAESYRIDCRPRGSSIDHMLMYIPESEAEPLAWVNAQSGEALVAERMPKNDPRLGGLPPGGELWQLRLRRPYARLVTITAMRTEPWPERRPVPLIAFPDAAEQRGRVVVESDRVALPTVVAARMQPTPLPSVDEAESCTEGAGDVRAIYRYQPVRFYDAGPAPELWLGPAADGTSGAALIAAQVQVESHYTASGSGASRRISARKSGADVVELKLPPGVSLASRESMESQSPIPLRRAHLIASSSRCRRIAVSFCWNFDSRANSVRYPLDGDCRRRCLRGR